jgi:hypothetical protein
LQVLPAKCTGIIPPIFLSFKIFFNEVTLIFASSISMSQKTGFFPECKIAFAVDANVIGEVTIFSNFFF